MGSGPNRLPPGVLSCTSNTSSTIAPIIGTSAMKYHQPLQTCSQCVRPVAGVTLTGKCLPKACSATRERLRNGVERRHATVFSSQAISTHASQTLRVGVPQGRGPAARVFPGEPFGMAGAAPRGRGGDARPLPHLPGGHSQGRSRGRAGRRPLASSSRPRFDLRHIAPCVDSCQHTD